MRFLQPDTLAEAVDLLGEKPGARRIVAGGTALVRQLHDGSSTPDALVSLARIPHLESIWLADGVLHIGALCLMRQIAASDEARRHVPALARACEVVGSARIRNQATIGGNLAEADYATDPPAALLALDAVVRTVGAGGERRIAIADFYRGSFQTALLPGEIVTALTIPLVPGARMIYLKFKSGSSPDRPCVAVAAVAAFDGEIGSDLRVAVGAATPTPRRLPAVEALASGQPLSDELISTIAEGYAREIEPLDDLRGSTWYRTQMIRVHVRRALEALRDGGR